MRNRFIACITGRTAVCASLAALVFFSRAWLIREWGSPLPFWDQWGSEGAHLLRPWLDGTIRWNDFFLSQNEHRVALTRAADLALFLANGRWNMWWELMLNAVLHATIATVVAYLLWPMLTGASRKIALFGLAVVFIAPSGWQNALWGFQSQVYFCILLSVLALAGLLLQSPFRPRWWLGWLAAILALFTQAAGVLAAVSAMLAVGFLAWVDHSSLSENHSRNPLFVNVERIKGKTATGCLVIFTVIVMGWVLLPSAPQHAPMHAQSFIQFGKVLARCLGWPWVNSDWMWIIMQAPSLWFAYTLLRQSTPPSSVEQLAFGLILFTALNAAAIAYSRGAGLPDARPLSRYQDPLLVGAVTNLFLALHLAGRHHFGRPAALALYGVLFAGLIPLTTTNFSLNLPYKRQQDAASLLQVRAYLATHDASIFTKDPNFPGPHPQPEAVREVLDDSLLVPILPAEITDLSARPPWPIESSPWLLAVSAALFLWALTTSGGKPVPTKSA